MLKVSIIIPVYNVEPYLTRCLDSVSNQTLKDIEIICVNDCSPDNSLSILKEYAQKDDRIKIIDFKENKGVGVARNTGIDLAQGEYIGFVDSDDYIDLNFYEELYNKALATEAELVLGNVKTPTGYNVFLSTVKQNRVNFLEKFCIGLYSSLLLKKYNIQFIEDCTYCEDMLLPLKSAIYANKIEFCEQVGYFYYNNENSASRSILTEQKLKDVFKSAIILLDFIQNTLTVNECQLIINQKVNHILSLASRTDDTFFPLYIELVENFYNNIKYDEIKISLDDFYIHRHDKNYLTNITRKKANKSIFNNLRNKIKHQ